MVDLISDGRLDLGVGRGFHPGEFQGFGVDQAHSQEIFDEALQIIKGAWTRETIAFQGRHFQIAEHAVRPKTIQRPHPPIWVAAITAASFEVAGMRGCNLLCMLVPGFHNAFTAEYLRTYRRALRASGHLAEKKQIGALCMVYCAETTEQARQDFAGPVLWYFRQMENYIAAHSTQSIATYEEYEKIKRFASNVRWGDLLEAGGLVCGSPEVCIRQIEKLRDHHGFTQLICWTRLSGLEHRKVVRSLELMGTHVLPYFHRESGRPKSA